MAQQTDDNQDIQDAVQHFVDAQIEGQEPDVDEFVKGYPQFEHQIRQMISNIRKVDELFATLTWVGQVDLGTTDHGDSLVGRRIRHFSITEMIGRGGMGVVYLARDTKLKRSVAIKSIPAALAGDVTAQTRFRREAELLASLNHPNIAAIYDIIQQDDRSGYLVLEYVPGETLAERIKRASLTMDEALSTGKQIAEAISAAHKKGVVHRDLKPGNIKITPDGHVKVLDFGLAKPLASENESSEITETQPGRVIGTPAYMSPEQARGKPTDHRTDIWSFGCIMYQMLTDQLPFDGETATDILARIIEREPDWGLLPQETPTEIRRLLHRCLEKDQGRRLENIADASVEISNTLTKTATASVGTIPTKSRRIVMAISAIVIIVLSALAVRFVLERQVQPSSKDIRLVVLPFENLGPDEDEYFADGITDDFTTRLAGLHGLAVISRQSAMLYKTTEKDSRQIAEELRVDYILEGTVQREQPSDPSSQVRIRCWLIKTSDITQVWPQPYEGQMSDIFLLQSEVAERVARTLGITLLEPEQQALVDRPTENTEAYDYYLRGREYYGRGDQESREIGIRMYEKAIDLDPNLAIAHAHLSYAYVRMYWRNYDPNEKRLEMARQAAERAMELAPELPEAYLCMGNYYYYGHADYDRALEYFEAGLRNYPDHYRLVYAKGYTQRRRGDFEGALASITKACELDPRSGALDFDMGNTLMIQGRYAEALDCFERSISLNPDKPLYYIYKAAIYLRQNNTREARRILEEGLQNVKTAERSSIVNSLADVDVYDRKYQAALDRLSSVSEYVDHLIWHPPYDLRCALIYEYMAQENKQDRQEKQELAQGCYQKARIYLETEIDRNPKRAFSAFFHITLGFAYAGLGLKDKAIDQGIMATELCSITKDALSGPAYVEHLALIYVMVGNLEAAMDQLESLVGVPRPGTRVCLYGLDPAWDPLRGHPRFQKLLESTQ